MTSHTVWSLATSRMLLFNCLVMSNSDPIDCNTPGFPVLQHLPKFAQVHASVMPSNHLILGCPLLLLPSIFPASGTFPKSHVFSSDDPKYWSFSICPSSEYSGLISLKIDWFDLLAVHGTFRSLLQHHS